MMQEKSIDMVALYVVYREDLNKYYAGFNSESNTAEFVSLAKDAKKFSNKYDIKLRPNEQICTLYIDLNKAPFEVSKPFRPTRKKIQKAV